MNGLKRAITSGFEDTNLGRVEGSWHSWRAPGHCSCCLLRVWASDEEYDPLCLSVARRSGRSMARWWHLILTLHQLGALECVFPWR